MDTAVDTYPRKTPAVMADPFQATRAVYQTTELLEHIFLQLPQLEVLRIKNVNKHFKQVIESSAKLTKKTHFLDPRAPASSSEQPRRVYLNPAIFAKATPDRSGEEHNGILTGLQWWFEPTITKNAFPDLLDTVSGGINLPTIAPTSSCLSMAICTPAVDICLRCTSSPRWYLASTPIRGRKVTLEQVLQTGYSLPGWEGSLNITFPRGMEVVIGEEGGEEEDEEYSEYEGISSLFE